MLLEWSVRPRVRLWVVAGRVRVLISDEVRLRSVSGDCRSRRSGVGDTVLCGRAGHLFRHRHPIQRGDHPGTSQTHTHTRARDVCLHESDFCDVGLVLDLEDYHPSVLLHCWLGRLTCKIVSEMT